MGTTEPVTMTATTTTYPETRGTDRQSTRFSTLARTVTTAFEHALVTAARAATWKHETAGEPGPLENCRGLAIGTGIEINRRCRVFDTPVTITLCTGTVTPSPSTRMAVEEIPVVRDGAVPSPAWASEPTDHVWLEVTAPGTPHQFLVDPSVPPQVSGAPEDAAMHRPHIIAVDAPGVRPPAYEVAENGTQALSTVATDAVQWTPTTITWPFGTPGPVSPVPADGGQDIAVTANTVVEMDARDGLAQLPADSVDVIITSPPYRLQRNYPDANAVWGGARDCTHQWNTEELYTDTPIRTTGGAGFNSSDDPAELRRDRWRESTTCTECGAWNGQLGLEPTLDEYIDHLTELFNHAKRVLKPSGSLWVNIADSYADGHRADDGSYRDAPAKALAGVPPKFELAMRRDGWIPRERCVWTKPSPTPDPAHDRRTPAYEHVYRFVLSEDYTDDTDQSTTDVLELNTVSGGTEHSAPMPKALPAAVLDSTLPSDMDGVVLDPFAGSGTVLEAAAEDGHDYLGFEISADAAATARNRLEQYDHDAKTLTGQASLTSFTGSE